MGGRFRDRPIYATPELWGIVLLTAAGGVLLGGLWTGVGLLAGGALGVGLLALGVWVRDRTTRSSGYDNRLDPWDD